MKPDNDAEDHSASTDDSNIKPLAQRKNSSWPSILLAILVLFVLALGWWFSRFTPDRLNVRGEWIAVENTTPRFVETPYPTRLTFSDDGTFTWTNVDPRVVGYGSYYEQQRSSLLKETRGSWGVYGELMGPAQVVHLTFYSPASASGVLVFGRGLAWSPRLKIDSYGEGTIVFKRAPEHR